MEAEPDVKMKGLVAVREEEKGEAGGINRSASYDFFQSCDEARRD